LAEVWSELSAAVPALAGVSYANIPDSGMLLDGTPWAGLPFAEGESLHFKPAK
jgi:NADH-quinone oxidoreductase subunit G